jgi:hypothetical protein
MVAVGCSPVFAQSAPVPLLKKAHPVDWWFAFKLNSGTFPNCAAEATRTCLFGGTVQKYKPSFGQQFVYASSGNGTLQMGSGCAGDTVDDPIGATFDQVYNGSFFYVLWNDQFYNDPLKSQSGTWGHSKGMLAWNDAGEGFVMQVSTPSWPAAGNKASPRKSDGNTLGCVKDNDVLVSQHFFALKLTKSDLVQVLGALQNASVLTNPKLAQLVRNGGPPDVQKLVEALGVKSKDDNVTLSKLSSGVQVISKPSELNVPPWQMVSAVLGGVSLRAATWWMKPAIYSTTASTKIGCWDSSLGKPGAVEIATTGHWGTTEIGLAGGSGPNFNHAKIGVSTSTGHHYSIFGDMNQQGAASRSKVPKDPQCDSSQNGRGGLFYVIDDPKLFESVTALIAGDSAPTKAPAK